ncbi:hypothetical protein D3C74_331650 [compost metagenome]
MRALRDRGLCLGRELLDAQDVVDELQPALLGVQAPAAEPPALRDDHTVRTGGRDLDLRGHGERLVLDVHDTVLREPPHPGEQQLAVPVDEGRAPGGLGVQPVRGPVVEREHVVLDRLDEPQALEGVQPFGLLGGQVVRLAVVGAAVVELPDVVVERDGRPADHVPRRAVLGDRAPPLVVDPPVAEHLEVLEVVALGRVCVVERVEHARALHG